jgi:nicotinamide-nucleotide amidase
MKVEVVTVGNDLLLSDIINTMSAHVTRKLLEVRASLTCRVTVGQDLSLLVNVLKTAVSRADTVVVVGGLNEEERYITLKALATITGHTFTADQKVHPAAQRLGGGNALADGWLLLTDSGMFVCLPRQRHELAYLLDAFVLPWLRSAIPAERVSGWVLLRTVGLMESNLRERLVDVDVADNSQIILDSFAGQTNIRLVVEGDSKTEVTAELKRLKTLVSERLGDYIYGEEDDRLERVVVRMLRRSQIKLMFAECNTGRVLARLLEAADEENGRVRAIPTYDVEQLAEYLEITSLPSQGDLTQWCRGAAERCLQRPDIDLGLIVYNHLTPGGIQMLITLASPMGVSVTQRSFSGRPENIDQWVCSLALAHLRRWLLAHGRGQ